MTQVAQFIKLAVSIFECCYFSAGFVYIIFAIDWAKIEREREAWQS